MHRFSPDWGRTVWGVYSHGSDEHRAGQRYWWDNRDREPAGAVVVQATLAGQIVLRRGPGLGSERQVGAGQVMVFRFGEATSYGWDGPLPTRYACEWVVLTGAGLVEHFEALRDLGGEVMGPDGALIDAIRSLRRSASEPTGALPGVSVSRECYGLFTRLIAASADAGLAGLSPVERAVEAIRREPYHDWSIKRLAQQHGVSREHLCRVFAQRVGQPPHAWLTTRRLDKALSLLRQTGLPVDQVAAQSGFSSVHTLARQVRSATGASPAALRGQASGARRPGEVNTSSAEIPAGGSPSNTDNAWRYADICGR